MRAPTPSLFTEPAWVSHRSGTKSAVEIEMGRSPELPLTSARSPSLSPFLFGPTLQSVTPPWDGCRRRRSPARQFVLCTRRYLIEISSAIDVGARPLFVPGAGCVPGRSRTNAVVVLWTSPVGQQSWDAADSRADPLCRRLRSAPPLCLPFSLDHTCNLLL